MDKLKMQSRDVVGGNVEKIAALFPHCVTERIGKDGTAELAIDFDKLRAELSNEVLEDGEERYQFTWPDKRAAARLANEPTTLTLRPCREESVNFDNTENLYIEGDNLDVLKVLRETYLGRVKMIYIDPPYNTGNDFVYNDDFAQGKEEFEQSSGLFDAEGNQTIDPMQRNTESNGRFHTDWLNMIYPRLKVARDFLSEDGVIFISIDENEIQNLRKITDEIFGESNFISQLGWQKVYSPKNQARYFSNDYEFVLCYCKDISIFSINMLPRTEAMNARYKNPDNDPRGPWKPGDCVGNGVRKNGYYDVVSPATGKIFNVPQGKHWVYAPDNMANMIADNRIWFGKDGNAFPSVKQFLSDVSGRRPSSLLMYEDFGHTDMAKKDVIKLFQEFEKVPFDTPKPVKLIKMLSVIGSNDNDIILDFFAGSATTAQSIIELNAENNGYRKFILVQLPELLQDHPEAVEKGFHTVSDVSMERIRRAGKRIRTELEESIEEKVASIRRLQEATPSSSTQIPLIEEQEDATQKFYEENILPLEKQVEALKRTLATLDVGFRVLKLDSSNMEDVYYTPDAFKPDVIDSLIDNIKPDRTPLDLLFQVMLDLGIELSAKIEQKEIAGKKVFSVDDDYLLACFDTDVNETTIEKMAKLLPTHLVIRDASATNDNVLDNFDQIIESYSNEKKINSHIL